MTLRILWAATALSLAVPALTACGQELPPGVESLDDLAALGVDETGSTEQALGAVTFPFPGSLLATPIDDALSADKVLWKSGRRRVEYRSVTVDELSVGVALDLAAKKATLSVDIPQVRIRGKFIRDRRVIRDKVRDVRADFRDIAIEAKFDFSDLQNPRLVSIEEASIRDIDFEGEGLVLDIVEHFIEKREGKIRREVEKALRAYLEENAERLIKRAKDELP
jgi:hypothetical protein